MNESLIQRLGSAFAAHKKQLYLVGGSVRDLLLGLEPRDLDFATNARTAEIRAIAEGTRPTGIAAMGEYVLGRCVSSKTFLRLMHCLQPAVRSLAAR